MLAHLGRPKEAEVEARRRVGRLQHQTKYKMMEGSARAVAAKMKDCERI